MVADHATGRSGTGARPGAATGARPRVPSRTPQTPMRNGKAAQSIVHLGWLADDARRSSIGFSTFAGGGSKRRYRKCNRKQNDLMHGDCQWTQWQLQRSAARRRCT